MDATNDSSNTAQTGLVLNGKEIPEVVLETIFSFVDIPTIVKLRQVNCYFLLLAFLNSKTHTLL